MDGPLFGQQRWSVGADAGFEIDAELGSLNFDASLEDYSYAVCEVPLIGRGAAVVEADFVFRGNQSGQDSFRNLLRINLSSDTVGKLSGVSCLLRQVNRGEVKFGMGVYSNIPENQWFKSGEVRPDDIGMDISTGISELLTMRLELQPKADGLCDGRLILREVGSEVRIIDASFELKADPSWLTGPKYLQIDSGQINSLGGEAAVNITRVHASVETE